MNLKRLIEHEGDTFDDIHKNIVYYGMRHEWGHWCGYMAIHPKHPFYKDIDEYSAEKFVVHGGVTYHGKSNVKFLKKHKIFTVGKNHYIIGFDCGHYNDILPFSPSTLSSNGTYRTKEYVIEQCKRMIDQVDEVYPEYMEKFNDIFKDLNS